MGTSGTGHDRCPSQFPGPSGARDATPRWRLKIKKTGFWFQGGGRKFFNTNLRWSACAQRPEETLQRSRAWPSRAFSRPRRAAFSSFCFCFSQRASSACERFSSALRSALRALLSRRARPRPFRVPPSLWRRPVDAAGVASPAQHLSGARLSRRRRLLIFKGSLPGRLVVRLAGLLLRLRGSPSDHGQVRR